MIWQWPWALLCGLSIPLLVILYWLRRRLRHRRVPSLLLWAQQRPRMSAGRRWQRWHSSRLFWLELALLMLLTLAAAGPRWLGEAQEPLYIILDDSLSMQAGGTDSPRNLAAAALMELLEDEPRRPVHWLLAGRRVRLLSARDGDPDPNPAVDLPEDWLEQRWRCLAPTADLVKGIAQAVELGGPTAHILVLTDHSPPDSVDTSQVRWWAMGVPRSNVALVGAGRRTDGGVDHLLLEVSNFSSQPVSTRLQVAWGAPVTARRPGDDGGPLAGQQQPAMTAAPPVQLQLAAGESRRQRWQVPIGSLVEAKLPDDALAADNRVVLLGEVQPAVKVALELVEGARRDLLAKALVSNDLAELVSPSSPEVDLRIQVGRAEITGSGGDSADSAGADSAGAWHLWLAPSTDDAQPYTGPFIVDPHHPLSDGLSLDGVIWGAAPDLRVADLSPSEQPVISAGDVPLLIDHGRGSGGRQLSLRWQGEMSNLQATPNWPVLWWNILAACAADRPGLEPINGRLGMPFHWRSAASATPLATLRSPGGLRREVAPGMVESDGLELGVHTLEWGEQRQAFAVNFAVNALNSEESDLRQAASARLGTWRPQRLAAPVQHRLWPYLLLLVLLLSSLHLVWSRPGTAAL